MTTPAAASPHQQRKNIVICADGTGNTTIKGRGTNVFKLYEAVDQAGHRLDPPKLAPQVAIYHDGVGTENIRWLALLSGATGYGLSRNVKQLYGELARAYAPGDKIFLFGFSRGAFTVRTLVGLIHACGILDLAKYKTNESFNHAIDEAYDEYRKQYPTVWTRLLRRAKPLDDERIKMLRARFSVGIPEFADEGHGKLIEFLGVWDTVDAVGLPIRAADLWNTFVWRFKFTDLKPSRSVAHACHALALDEERESFTPVLWDESAPRVDQRVEQVWFAGVHSNVGGGYPRQGMSLVALDWMMCKAEDHGLRFVRDERLSFRYHGDVDDKMYDSRAGAGVFYRWKPRDVEALCERHSVVPKVHRSVFERIARNTEGYAPGSVPPNPTVISTSASPAMLAGIQELVCAQHANKGPIARRAAKVQWFGRMSYWLLVYGVLVTAFFTLWAYVDQTTAGVSGWLATAKALVANAASTQWVGLLLRTLWRHPSLIAWMLVTYGIGMLVDARIDRRYSEFWHRDDLRLKLRKLIFASDRREGSPETPEAVVQLLHEAPGASDVIGT